MGTVVMCKVFPIVFDLKLGHLRESNSDLATSLHDEATRGTNVLGMVASLYLSATCIRSARACEYKVL